MTQAGVVVLGMHRSGTSAITRTVNLLGVPTCIPGDLIRDRTANLRGHWESGTLVRRNEELIQAAGGAWWCPPPLETDWLALAGDRLRDSAEAFDRVHPTPSWVWKDPRTCMTAPFWQAALPHRLTFLLAVRHPLAVAASLATRNALTSEAGVALWEGYMARAARAAGGAPVIVCSYEDMLRDPLGWAQAAGEFLRSQEIELDPRGSPARAARFVEETLAHHRQADGGAKLTEEQTELLRTLTALVGPHEQFDPDLPPVTEATERLFAERRRLLLPPAERAAVKVAPSGIELLERVRARPDELPQISVVIAPRRPGPGLEPTLAAVLATAPDSAEVIVVGEIAAPGDPRVTVLDRPAVGGRVAAIGAGLALAAGELVVLCDRGVEPNQGWPEVFAKALKRSDVGAVGPALLHRDCAPVYGLTLREACLNVSWITAAPGVEPFSVAAVTGAMLVCRRDTLDAVGGFDPGMTGSGGEDVELCIRLWRAGCLCLTAPRTSAFVRFDCDEPPDPTGFLRNRLRLGLLHLSPPRLRRFLEPFQRSPDFPEAFARVLASDVGDRRVLVDAISCFDDSWLLQHFGIAGLEEPTVNSPQERSERELVRS